MNKKIDRRQLSQFGNLELLAKQVVEGFITGLHKSPLHGFSVEFAEHRLYNAGESTRHIDWKLYARSEKLFTKKYEEETNLRCQIVIDQSSSMYFPEQGDPNKFEYSVYAAASLIELLKRQRDAVGVSFISDRLDLQTPAKSSTAHHRYLYAELENRLKQYSPTERKETDTSEALHAIAELCHRRSLIVIFTDFLEDPSKADAFFDALQHMRHNKHEVIVFHVLQKSTELDFQLENRPYELIDMETGEAMKLQPAAIREKYVQSVKAYFKELKLRCTNNGIDFMPCDIDSGMHQMLLSYLLKRQKLY
jgi:uncharacterized protein (DUF58 family)